MENIGATLTLIKVFVCYTYSNSMHVSLRDNIYNKPILNLTRKKALTTIIVYSECV